MNGKPTARLEGQTLHSSPPLSRHDIVRTLFRRLSNGWIFARAAQMSFYLCLSVFPMLLVLMTALSLFLDARRVLRDTLLQQLAPLVPPSMFRMISDLLAHFTEEPTGSLTWGIAITVWAASSGMVATIDGLNEAYAITERRSWWKRRLVGLTLTLVVMLVMTVATVLMTLGAPLTTVLAQRAGLETSLPVVWQLVRWPAFFCFTLVAFDLLYHFGPNRQRAAWRWLPMETLIAIALWLAASLGLKAYLTRFGNYSVIYGALGGVIVLLLWFYVTAIAILAGALIATLFGHRVHSIRSANPDAHV